MYKRKIMENEKQPETDASASGTDQSPSANTTRTNNNNDIVLRSASHGWWLSALIPSAYLINVWKHERALTFEYKFSSIIVFGLFLQTLEICAQSKKLVGRRIAIILFVKLIPAAVMAFLLHICLHQSIGFSAVSSLTSTIVYSGLFFYVLKRLPKSFTYGEASVILQGFTLFLLNAFIRFIEINDYKPATNMERMSTILQIGLVGVTFIVETCHFVQYFQGLPFYGLLGFVLLLVILFPIGNEIAVIILYEFITSDLERLCIISLYLGLVGITVAVTMWHINRKQASNTRLRKIFHILIVLVYLPGLMFQCTFLFVASGIALAVLIILETARIIKLWPIANVLEQSVKSFIDEKDSGLIAMTPLYLLIGCSLPLWLHPCPCDVTDATFFELLPLMSGVLSVGIGDTAASVIGSTFGRIKYPGSSKTVEGTIASIVAQASVLPILAYIGVVHLDTILLVKFSIAVTTNAIVELLTDQVDNLVLPLVTFIVLSI